MQERQGNRFHVKKNVTHREIQYKAYKDLVGLFPRQDAPVPNVRGWFKTALKRRHLDHESTPIGNIGWTGCDLSNTKQSEIITFLHGCGFQRPTAKLLARDVEYCRRLRKVSPNLAQASGLHLLTTPQVGEEEEDMLSIVVVALLLVLGFLMIAFCAYHFLSWLNKGWALTS